MTSHLKINSRDYAESIMVEEAYLDELEIIFHDMVCLNEFVLGLDEPLRGLMLVFGDSQRQSLTKDVCASSWDTFTGNVTAGLGLDLTLARVILPVVWGFQDLGRSSTCMLSTQGCADAVISIGLRRLSF